MSEASTPFSAPPTNQSLPPGTRLQEFTIERVLGSGGFGITYLARDSRLGRQVVIKENLPAQFCWRDTSSLTVRPRHSSGEDADNFQYSLESFEKEAATLASLDHPGIVKVLRSFEANGTAYFVMPFVEGVTFAEVLRKREAQHRPFTEAELVALLDKVLAALGYLHERGIYHRDIKPSNLLITASGDPVLIDFGAARQRVSERSLTVIESPGYTPFEQMQSRGKVGPWSDLYALGGTLYKAITGETPAKAADRIMEDEVMPLARRADLVSRYSVRVLASVDKALAVKPSQRFQNAHEWIAQLANRKIDSVGDSEGLAREGKNVLLESAETPGGFVTSMKSSRQIQAARVGVASGITILMLAVFLWNRLADESVTPQSSENHESKATPETMIAAQVVVTSDREGAEVRQGTNTLGKTPLLVSLPFGDHSLDVVLPPWETQRILVRVGYGGKATPSKVTAKFPLGQVRVTSEERDAEVWIGEERFGRVPAVLNLKPGEHEIEMRLHGWKPKIFNVLVDSAGNSNPPNWNAKFEAGVLKVEGSPEGTEVAVIHEEGMLSKWEILPITKRLPPGKVVAKFRKAGFDEMELEGVIEEAKSLMLKAALEPSHPLNHGTTGAGFTIELPGSAKMDFRYCPAGNFLMGTRTIGYGNWELPAKGIEDEKAVEVEISQGFWIGQTEVTQQQWQTLMASSPSELKGNNLPVENVSFVDAQKFVETLNERLKLPSTWRFALPTEAQWEYACRAGSTTAFSFGDSLFGDQANFNGGGSFDKKGKYLAKPISVGTYRPNDWGIHDMHGNVAEWCNDWYAISLSAGTDPVGPRYGTERVVRGGSWWGYNGACRSARRDQRPPNTRSSDLGIRITILR